MTDEKLNGKGWADFEFKIHNKYALGRVVGRSEHDRAVSGKMGDMLDACKEYDEVTIVPISDGLDADAKMVNDAIYSMLAGETSGQAHEIVRSEEHRRCGITTWVRLRTRFKRPDMTSIIDANKLQLARPTGGALAQLHPPGAKPVGENGRQHPRIAGHYRVEDEWRNCGARSAETAVPAAVGERRWDSRKLRENDPPGRGCHADGYRAGAKRKERRKRKGR